MQQEPGLKWLFLDLNSYFASVEQQENSKLRGKPTAVVPLLTDATCVIAASYEAKAYGIRTGTNVGEAKRLCPSLQCVLARHDLYVDYHHRILEEFIHHAPINKIWSIDELSSRLPPGKREPEKAEEIASKIKEGLWRNVGEAINCSIGIAPNSLLAKIAAEMKKPNGLTLIRQEDLPGPLLDLQLRDIPGIGFNMEERLMKAGICSVKRLWDISPKQARKVWGSVQGERLWYWLHGYDFEAPENGNAMIGHSRVLDPDLRCSEKARLVARRLLVKATYRLRRKGLYADTLTLGVRSVNNKRWKQDVKMPSAQDPFTFLQHLEILWREMEACGYRRFKKVAVLLSGLRTSSQLTQDLFDTCLQENMHKVKKNEALAKALDRLQEKYEKETVWVGVIPETLAGHVGTKIAFSRVPDRTEFWE